VPAMSSFLSAACCARESWGVVVAAGCDHGRVGGGGEGGVGMGVERRSCVRERGVVDGYMYFLF
jgi:hypothetical protein